MELLMFDEAAKVLGLQVTRVTQLISDGHVVAVRDPETGRRGIPASMIMDGEVVKSLTAVITLLRDAKFSDDEIVEWLQRVDDSLPGSPIDALRENRGTEVKRRAQVAGF